jgi:hypothetical protein
MGQAMTTGQAGDAAIVLRMTLSIVFAIHTPLRHVVLLVHEGNRTTHPKWSLSCFPLLLHNIHITKTNYFTQPNEH